MKHPTLYKKTSTGADQYWSVEVQGNRIISRWGQVGGAENRTDDVITEGKNIGKANETSAAEQAGLEAKALWEKKLKKGYVQSLSDARAGKTDAAIEGGIFPMLAHKFSEQGHKIVYPAFAQPKLDGHRCIAMPDGTLWSRTRKPIVSMPHVSAAIKKLKLTFPVDGELYNHEYHDRFEELTSLIRPDYVKAGHEVVQYHIYDYAMPGTFKTRIFALARNLAVLPRDKTRPLRLVDTPEIANEDELMLAFEKFRAQGYEGAMVRNADGLYVNKRSYDLQKVKEFDDAEFEITDVVEGRGKLVGHGIFVCKTKSGTAFQAKMTGSLSDLKKFYEHPDKYKGKMLTVKYQGLTNKSEVPRFPVALRIREE